MQYFIETIALIRQIQIFSSELNYPSLNNSTSFKWMFHYRCLVNAKSPSMSWCKFSNIFFYYILHRKCQEIMFKYVLTIRVHIAKSLESWRSEWKSINVAELCLGECWKKHLIFLKKLLQVFEPLLWNQGVNLEQKFIQKLNLFRTLQNPNLN